MTSLLTLAVGGLGEMAGPTLSGSPVIDGSVEEAEWGVAESFSFNSPRSGTSTLRMGYIAETGDLALGLVLADQTPMESGSNKDRLEVFLTRETPDDTTTTADRKFVIHRDGSFSVYKGNGNATTGFASTPMDSGNSPASADASLWAFAVHRSAASWEVEMLVDIGSKEAGEAIGTVVQQVDYNSDGESKTSSRPGGFNVAKPSGWERTVLTGRPTVLQFSVSPTNMEAGVGGDIIVSLPADASGGRLTVQVKEPGGGGFIPIGTKQAADPGANRFHLAPLETGSWSVQAVWAGDGKYASITTNPQTISVARPAPDGVTIMETGALRTAFAAGAEGSPSQWRYLNTQVDATDADGDLFTLERLDKSNSCRKDPWVGMANMGDGPMTLTFDPPVLRAALALTSPEGPFTANLQAYTSTDKLKDEVNGQGSCNQPLFASLGDTEDDVQRIEIDYGGDDPREVLDVLFTTPVRGADPQTVVRTDPSPLHAGGSTELHVSSGSSYQLDKIEVTVTGAAQTIETETCDPVGSQAWVTCTFPIQIPATAEDIQVLVKSTSSDGSTQWTHTHTLDVEEDMVPPRAWLLPKPLVAGKGAAVALTAGAQDASGIQNISMRAEDQHGNLLNQATCTPDADELEALCTMGVTPAEDAFSFATATITDNRGNTVTLGPKPIPVRGTDTDGDGLPDDLELHIGTSPNLADTDGDGLSDGWEVMGVDRNGDGQAELDLAAAGADPQVRDLFLEIDWAEHKDPGDSKTHSHKPSYAAIQLVRNVLSAQGIRLHVDAHQHGGPYDPARFDHAHAAHRHLMDTDRAGIYLHVLAGHMGGPSADEGGLILLPTETTKEQSPSRVGADLLRAIGHHLGLGPGGGGEDDKGTHTIYTEDHKPNYLSIMNSAYAWGIYVDTVDGMVRVPTLAGVSMSDIDENALDEPSGLEVNLPDLHDSLRAGPTHVLADNSLTGVQIRYTCPGDGLVRWASPLGSIDWNCDGTTDDTGVSVDVNVGGQNRGITELTSRTDWDNLSFRGPTCPHYGLMVEDHEDHPAGTTGHGASYAPLGLAPCPLHEPAPRSPAAHIWAVTSVTTPSTPFEDPDGEDNDLDGKVDEGFADDDEDGIINLLDDCPRKISVVQRDDDRDMRGDACQDAPGELEGARAVYDAEFAEVKVSWEEGEDLWGYNLYKVEAGNVTRMGEGFPTTTGTTWTDTTGSASATYLLRGVNDLGDQGPMLRLQPTMAQPSGNATDGDGQDGGQDAQDGVPGPGVLVALVVAGAVAVARRRRA